MDRYIRRTPRPGYEDNRNMDLTELRVKTVVIDALLLFFGLITLMSSFYINSEYERTIETRMGVISDFTGPGLHFKIPFFESAHTADTRIEPTEIDMQVATKGGTNIIGMKMTINHRIDGTDGNLRGLYEQFGSRYDYESRLLTNLAQDRAKAVISTYAVEDVVDKRGEIRIKVKEAVVNAVSGYGIKIPDLQLSDLSFSDAYRKKLDSIAEARAKAARAEQAKREAAFNADKAIEVARGNAESKKLEADAQAHKIKVESIENAAATKREGEAKAAALKAQARALKSSPELVELTKAEAMKNWDGTSMPTILGGGSGSAGLFPFMNVMDVIKK